MGKVEPRVRAIFAAADTPVIKALARQRIQSNLRRLSMATRKTLESKVSEAGRQRVSPIIVTQVIRAMLLAKELIPYPTSHGRDVELLALPGTPDDVIKARRAVLSRALTTFHRFTQGSADGEGVVGKAGEDMIARAFAASPTMSIVNWGDKASQHFRGVTFGQPSDGIVVVDQFMPGLTPIEHCAIVEVKNRRDWVTPEDIKPWKLIRNAYKADVVGIYFARRILRSTFWLLFKRLGAVGVETFNQFAPAEIEPDLRDARDKNGLGYHDLYFSADVPSHLQKQVNALPQRIQAARSRMIAIREIAAPFIYELAEKAPLPQRKELIADLKSAIAKHDKPEDREVDVEDADNDADRDDGGPDESDEDGDTYRRR